MKNISMTEHELPAEIFNNSKIGGPSFEEGVFDIRADLAETDITESDKSAIEELINSVNALKVEHLRLHEESHPDRTPGLFAEKATDKLRGGAVYILKKVVTNYDKLSILFKYDSLISTAVNILDVLDYIADDLDQQEWVKGEAVSTRNVIKATLAAINDNFPRLQEIAQKGDKRSVYALQAFNILYKRGSWWDTEKAEAEIKKHIPMLVKGFEKNPDPHIDLIQYVVLYGEAESKEKLKNILIDQYQKDKFDCLTNLIGSVYSGEMEEFGLNIIEEQLTKSGLKGGDFIDWWTKSYGNKKKDEAKALHSNLYTISKLNKLHPGAVKILTEKFSIYNFGRYPLNVLENQYKEIINKDLPYGVIIYPKDDWNGAFNDDEKIYEELMTQLQGKCNLRVVECASKWDVGRRLIEMSQNYGPATFAIIGGHGSPDSVMLGDAFREGKGGNADRYKLYKKDLEGKGVRSGVKFFIDSPTFILVACSTGKDTGIGQRLSEVFDAKVIAPETPANIKSIKAEFEENGALNLSAIYKEEAQRYYKQGQEVSQKKPS
jgi:hypothetical protein